MHTAVHLSRTGLALARSERDNARMANLKSPPAPSKTRWTNEVVKTSDGRLLVRGVDIPTKGAKSPSPEQRSAPSSFTQRNDGLSLNPNSSKRIALATATRAGLVVNTKSSSSKPSQNTIKKHPASVLKTPKKK